MLVGFVMLFFGVFLFCYLLFSLRYPSSIGDGTHKRASRGGLQSSGDFHDTEAKFQEWYGS